MDYHKYDSDGTLYLVLGVVEAVLCNLLLGAGAAIFAYLGMEEAKKDRFDIADNRFKVSKILLLVGLVLGIARVILIIVMLSAYGVFLHDMMTMF